MRLSVDLTVKDVRASAEFYRKLGFDVPDVWEQGGEAHHCTIPDGPMMNSLPLTKGFDPSWPDGPGLVLIFHVEGRDAVDAKHAELVGGGFRSHLSPFDAFWGARYAIVDDPDGNHVGIMSESDQEHKSAPGI
jgi:uncharacterized glyoxalase superfamily protein PhnB